MNNSRKVNRCHTHLAFHSLAQLHDILSNAARHPIFVTVAVLWQKERHGTIRSACSRV